MPGGQPRPGVPIEQLGSKLRIDQLIEEYRKIKMERPEEVIDFVLAGGFSKESPDEPTAEAPESLADQMEQYLDSQNIFFGVSKAEPAWGTYEETLAAIIAAETYKRDSVQMLEVVLCTNLGHMPRVRLCWLFSVPKELKGIKVRFVTATKQSYTQKEWFQEFGKFFVYFYRFVFKKW
jgi:hypothetical protein